MAGGRDEKGAMARQTTEKGAMTRQTTVKTLPRTVSVAAGRDEERRIEGEHRREDKENQVKTPPLATIVAGGARQKAKTNTKWKGDTTHSLTRAGSA